MASMEMKLMPIAVLNALLSGSLSLPQYKREVSRAMEVLRPDVTRKFRISSLIVMDCCPFRETEEVDGDEINLLDRAIIVPIPRSGTYVCSVQREEKSPIVHPMRQRNVLMPALFQVPRQDQKARLDIDSAGFVETVLPEAIPSFFEAWI